MDKLTKEEKEILLSFEKGEWKSLNPSRKKMNEYQEYARETVSKNKRVNIRISGKDLKKLQIKALQEGVPYQTFIASILHKFVEGRI